MSRRKPRMKAEETEVDLTPMLDVVFIMLIFFIVTATFIRERGLDVVRPDNNEEQQQTSVVAIVISVDNNNDVWVDGRVVDERAVRANVERLRADSPESPVLIQADREADTGVVIRTMDQAKLGGAVAVSLATIEN